MVTYVEGELLAAASYLSPATLSGLGDLVAVMSATLADFDHAGLDRRLQWDLRYAKRVVDLLLPHVGQPDRAAALTAAVARAELVMAGVGELPVEPIHGDLTEDNVVGRRDESGRLLPGGVIDFGDLAYSWRVGDLAVACTSLLYRAASDPMLVLPVIRVFDARLPLTDGELEALWPLVVERAAGLVVSGQQQVTISPDNDYAGGAQARDWSIFECATSVPFSAMIAALRHALGRAPSGPVSDRGVPAAVPALDPPDVVVLDFRLPARAWIQVAGSTRTPKPKSPAEPSLAGGRAAVTRFAECRLTRSRPDIDGAATELCVAHRGATTRRPISLLRPRSTECCGPSDNGLKALEGSEGFTMTLSGVEREVGWAGVGGRPDRVNRTSRRCGSSWARRVDPSSPVLIPAKLAAGWLAVCADPTPLLGLAVSPVSPTESLPIAQRDAFAAVQEHYYATPPQIERGWRQHLVDVTGRVYLDMINNVTVVGHGHPRLAAAAARQWSLLNTNSRFHYAALGEFAERLAALAPEGLDAVFLVNSGTEANDLALRLASTHTGRADVVCIREGYHGWSLATDAVRPRSRTIHGPWSAGRSGCTRSAPPTATAGTSGARMPEAGTSRMRSRRSTG